MNREQFLDEVRKAIRHEVREAGLLDDPATYRSPLPFDRGAEENLLACCITGNRPPAWLDHTDFYFNLHGALYAVFTTYLDEDLEVTRARAGSIVLDMGLSGGVQDALDMLWELVPQVRWAERDARTVAEMARRRRVLDKMALLDAMMRSPAAKRDELDEVLGDLNHMWSVRPWEQGG